jgi:hypothetical protein
MLEKTYHALQNLVDQVQRGAVRNPPRRNEHNMKTTIKLLAMALLVGTICLNAETIQVTFNGTTGVNNGSDYVLPYFLTVGSLDISADCYDLFNEITTGESWMANIDTLGEAASSGMFSADRGALQGYELIGVLSTLLTPTPQSQIDIQQDMWNVFDQGAFATTASMASYLWTASSEIPTFNFGSVEYIEPVAGSGTQAFVASSNAPEPTSLFLLGAGLLALSLMRRRRPEPIQ